MIRWDEYFKKERTIRQLAVHAGVDPSTAQTLATALACRPLATARAARLLAIAMQRVQARRTQ